MPHVLILCGIVLLLGEGSASGQDVEAPAAPAASPRVYVATANEDETWKQDVLVALIGGGARFRRVGLEVGDLAGGTESRSLDTGAYFDFGWHMLIRPMGHRSPRASIRAIVLQIDGGAGIGLEVQPEESGISLETNSWRLLGQFGYLYPIHRLQVGGLVGIGGDVFNIDLNSVLPSSRIVYVRLGPAAQYALVGDSLSIRVDFGLRFPFHLGEIANAFGTDSRAFGLDSTFTLGGHIHAGFSYAFRFVWEYYTYRFSGPIDNVPSMGDGGRGGDHAINFQFLLGWSL
jgi:hypothetical protein